MFQKLIRLSLSSAIVLGLSCVSASAQHLWWDLAGQKDATCLYGEITVLATNPGIYFCGANWHPGEPAGGYCGIQHNTAQERRTIFSIWDTTADLHPHVSESDAKTICNRFGGEGTGAHTHMIWPWQSEETFRFFVQKSPGGKPATTDARYYAYDRRQKNWLHVATIVSPIGDKVSAATLGGGLNSFLENFTGGERNKPKLALYRLWLGPSCSKMKCLIGAKGDGSWGVLHDAYYLAEGDADQLTRLFALLEPKYGKPASGGKDVKLPPIADQAMPPELIEALQNLPRAAATRDS